MKAIFIILGLPFIAWAISDQMTLTLPGGKAVSVTVGVAVVYVVVIGLLVWAHGVACAKSRRSALRLGTEITHDGAKHYVVKVFNDGWGTSVVEAHVRRMVDHAGQEMLAHPVEVGWEQPGMPGNHHGIKASSQVPGTALVLLHKYKENTHSEWLALAGVPSVKFVTDINGHFTPVRIELTVRDDVGSSDCKWFLISRVDNGDFIGTACEPPAVENLAGALAVSWRGWPRRYLASIVARPLIPATLASRVIGWARPCLASNMARAREEWAKARRRCKRRRSPL